MLLNNKYIIILLITISCLFTQCIVQEVSPRLTYKYIDNKEFRKSNLLSIFYVVAGSCDRKADALVIEDEYKTNGIETLVIWSDEVKKFRVVIGPFCFRENAENFKISLKDKWPNKFFWVTNITSN